MSTPSRELASRMYELCRAAGTNPELAAAAESLAEQLAKEAAEADPQFGQPRRYSELDTDHLVKAAVARSLMHESRRWAQFAHHLAGNPIGLPPGQQPS